MKITAFWKSPLGSPSRPLIDLRKMANRASLNTSNPAIKRILSEVKKMEQDPSPDFEAHPVEDNLFDWHFVLRGPSDSPFEGGLYHGRIILPAQYPFQPPEFMFLCPQGRFEIGKKICLSISQHHPELWQPGWDIRTALTAIQSFMPTPGSGAIAALDYTDSERRTLARKSAEATKKSLKACSMLDSFTRIFTAPPPASSSGAAAGAASSSPSLTKEECAASEREAGSAREATSEVSERGRPSDSLGPVPPASVSDEAGASLPAAGAAAGASSASAAASGAAAGGGGSARREMDAESRRIDNERKMAEIRRATEMDLTGRQPCSMPPNIRAMIDAQLAEKAAAASTGAAASSDSTTGIRHRHTHAQQQAAGAGAGAGPPSTRSSHSARVPPQAVSTASAGAPAAGAAAAGAGAAAAAAAAVRPAYAPANYTPAHAGAQEGVAGRAAGGAARGAVGMRGLRGGAGGGEDVRSDDEKALDNFSIFLAVVIGVLLLRRFLIVSYPDVEWGEEGVAALRAACEAIDNVVLAIASLRF